MPVFPFCGSSYNYRSRNFDAQRAVNQYYITSESQNSKAPSAMVGSPGRTLFTNLSVDGTRGGREVLGRAFFVSGLGFYEVLSDGTNIKRGSLLTQYGQVGMTDNGQQICIVDGANGYIFALAAIPNTIQNGTFSADVSWTKGTGWTISGGVATAASSSSAISQAPSPYISGVSYTLTYTIVVSSGTLTPSLGGTAGVTRSASGTYTETIVAGSAYINFSSALLSFTGASFSGTLTNVTLAQPANSFGQITNPYFQGSTTVCYIDGYFIFSVPNTGEYYISALYDGSTGDPTMFSTAENSTDNIIAVHALKKQLWIFSKNNIEVYYDAGAVFPFAPIVGAFVEYGCNSPYSIVSVANTVFWVGNDQNGSGTVFMTNGYQPTRISTSPLETAIQSYGDISATVGYSYQEDGRYFYLLIFPNAPTVWSFDIAQQEWHERVFYNESTGQEERDRVQCHVFCFNLHLVGDYANGNVYQQSLNIYTDNGNPIRRLRSAPHISDDLEYIYHKRFILDMQTGVGLTTGNIADVDPAMVLQWSDDGGYTWSNEHSRTVGKIGNYRKRAIWRMLGRSRDRVYRAIYTAATQYFVIAAHLDVEKGQN